MAGRMTVAIGVEALLRRVVSEVFHADVDASACYVMPILVDPAGRERVRAHMRERHGVQTSVLYPAVHEFTAYASLTRAPLPRSERVARAQITLPLYPHLSEAAQDRVVAALADALARG